MGLASLLKASRLQAVFDVRHVATKVRRMSLISYCWLNCKHSRALLVRLACICSWFLAAVGKLVCYDMCH